MLLFVHTQVGVSVTLSSTPLPRVILQCHTVYIPGLCVCTYNDIPAYYLNR